jgi:hypothetical protein
MSQISACRVNRPLNYLLIHEKNNTIHDHNTKQRANEYQHLLNHLTATEKSYSLYTLSTYPLHAETLFPVTMHPEY